MKIVSAVCEPWNAEVKAIVVICDEGLQFTGEATSLRPAEAVHAALSHAVRQVSDRLHDKLSIKHEVTF